MEFGNRSYEANSDKLHFGQSQFYEEKSFHGEYHCMGET